MSIMFMTTRCWIGAAILLLVVALGTGLQGCYGKLFQTNIETGTRGPEKPVSDGDFTFQIIEEKTCHIHIVPNWPIAAPLALLACAGLALVVIPRRTTWKRKPG
jgi:hypothetical protein